MPGLPAYAKFALEAEGKDMSTTMAFVRLLGALLKDKAVGPRIVPAGCSARIGKSARSSAIRSSLRVASALVVVTHPG